LAITIGAYALALTVGRHSAGLSTVALAAIAIVGLMLFIRIEGKAASPLIRLALLRNRKLAGGFVTSGLVSTVLMSTLIVGPFHLSGALGLDAAMVGLVIAIGPLVAALLAAPAGRAVDRLGALPVTMAGLVAIGVGCGALALLPLSAG